MPKVGSVSRQKIAMLLFPNSKMGGILTVHSNLKLGFEKLGYEVVDYYLTDNKNKISAPKDQTGKSQYCQGRALGIREQHIRSSVSEISKYPIVVYDAPAPSLNKAFNDPSWQKLYSSLNKKGCKQISLWHDPFWKDYYPWVDEIHSCIDVVGAIQSKAYDNLPESLMDKAFICNHPLSLVGMGEYGTCKEDLVISPHQFKSWKKIHLFIQGVPEICRRNVKVEVFNGGIEYWFMAGSLAKRKPKYKVNGKWIWDEAIKSGMNYRGTVSSTEIEAAFKRQKCVVDLSVGELGGRKGKDYRSLNYSVLECMKYGGVPVTRFYSTLPPFTNENFLIVDEEQIVQSTSTLCLDAVKNYNTLKLKAMRSCNRDILLEHYEASKVAKSLIERL